MVSHYEEMISLYVRPKLLDRPRDGEAFSLGDRVVTFGPNKRSAREFQDSFLAVYHLE